MVTAYWMAAPEYWKAELEAAWHRQASGSDVLRYLVSVVQHCALGWISASADGKHGSNSLVGPHAAAPADCALLRPTSSNIDSSSRTTCSSCIGEVLLELVMAGIELDLIEASWLVGNEFCWDRKSEEKGYI